MLIQARVCEKRQEQTSKIPNIVTFEHGPKERRMIFFFTSGMRCTEQNRHVQKIRHSRVVQKSDRMDAT